MEIRKRKTENERKWEKREIKLNVGNTERRGKLENGKSIN